MSVDKDKVLLVPNGEFNTTFGNIEIGCVPEEFYTICMEMTLEGLNTYSVSYDGNEANKLMYAMSLRSAMELARAHREIMSDGSIKFNGSVYGGGLLEMVRPAVKRLFADIAKKFLQPDSQLMNVVNEEYGSDMSIESRVQIILVQLEINRLVLVKRGPELVIERMADYCC